MTNWKIKQSFKDVGNSDQVGNYFLCKFWIPLFIVLAIKKLTACWFIINNAILNQKSKVCRGSTNNLRRISISIFPRKVKYTQLFHHQTLLIDFIVNIMLKDVQKPRKVYALTSTINLLWEVLYFSFSNSDSIETNSKKTETQ